MRDPIHQIALCSCFCGVKIPLCARFTTGCDISEVNDESGGRVVDCEEKVFGDLLWWSCTVGCQNGLLSSFGGTYFTVCGPHTDYKWSHYELHAGKLPHCSSRPTQSLQSKIIHCIGSFSSILLFICSVMYIQFIGQFLWFVSGTQVPKQMELKTKQTLVVDCDAERNTTARDDALTSPFTSLSRNASCVQTGLCTNHAAVTGCPQTSRRRRVPETTVTITNIIRAEFNESDNYFSEGVFDAGAGKCQYTNCAL